MDWPTMDTGMFRNKLMKMRMTDDWEGRPFGEDDEEVYISEMSDPDKSAVW